MFWVLMKNLTNSFPFTNSNQKASGGSSNAGGKTSESRKRITYNLLAMNENENEDEDEESDGDQFEESVRGDGGGGGGEGSPTSYTNSIFKSTFKSRGEDYGRLKSSQANIEQQDEPSNFNKTSSTSSTGSSNFLKFPKVSGILSTGGGGGKSQIELGKSKSNEIGGGGNNNKTNTLTALKFTFEDFSDESDYDEDEDEESESEDECREKDDEDGDEEEDYHLSHIKDPNKIQVLNSPQTSISPHESCSTADDDESLSSSSSSTSHHFQKPRPEITGTRTIMNSLSST